MIRRAFRSDGFRGVVVSAAKPTKGFGSVRKSGEQKAKPDDDRLNDKMVGMWEMPLPGVLGLY